MHRHIRRPPGRALSVLSLICWSSFALVAGCGGGDTPNGAQATIVITDENNYSATGTLNIPTVETAAGAAAADLEICWDGLVTDLQCHPVAPKTDIDNVSIVRFTLTPEDVQAKIAGGEDIPMANVNGYLEHPTLNAGTCAKLTDFTFLGTKVDPTMHYIEMSNYTYMLLFSKGTDLNVGGRSMLFLKPTSSSATAMVAAKPGCGLLDFKANLHSLKTVSVPAQPPYIADWSGVTQSGQGHAVPKKIDKFLIGFYQGKTVADLEMGIFDIELSATNLWELKLTTAGKTADLSKATEKKTGLTFPGFQAGGAGTWMLAIVCSGCQNPAPVVLTILQPGAAN